MKLIFKLLAVALACVAFGSHINPAKAASNTSIELCGSETQSYKYALCAASTCTPTGKRIAVNTPNGGKRWFKEAVCTCPVMDTTTTGPAIANVRGGNMQGNCERPNAATLWSLYSVYSPFPQPSDANPPVWQTLPAKPHACSASLNQGREYANCFSFKCENIRTENGVELADCRCPLGEDVFSALPTKPATSFFTDAGGNWANPQDACYAHPVGGF